LGIYAVGEKSAGRGVGRQIDDIQYLLGGSGKDDGVAVSGHDFAPRSGLSPRGFIFY